MFRRVVKIINIASQPNLLKQLIGMGSSGYLYDVGWIKSFISGVPVDKDGNPLAWVTYSFMDFIEDRLNNGMEIFEFGAGNSTLWYAGRVDSVTSVEHDQEWYEKIRNKMPDNVSLYHRELKYGGEYSRFPNQLEKRFDIIIVDGRDRVNCMKHSVESIKEGGIIVLDDSERAQYMKGVEFLLNRGFKKLDFWGISPGLFYKKCTTVFYKKENCLGI